MPKFRKKPIVIEAMQFTEETKNQVFNFVRCTCFADFDKMLNPILIISTLEGDMTVRLGDWVIRGVEGEFYPCKNDIFQATYEPIETNQSTILDRK